MEVQRDGRPLPVEYLLVDVPCGVRKQSLHTFSLPRSAKNAFPIENRTLIGQTQVGSVIKILFAL
jgi:nuclear protein localization family protein 4